ncbi:MAG: UV DNA damage repair endonuclease UvsE [bacterium]
MSVRRLGYPCIRVGSDPQTVKRCQLRNASPERLRQLIDRNLDRLKSVLEFNVENSISLFRIHSDTIPFASHPDVDFDWLAYAGPDLRNLGDFIETNNLRVSMHPGQYTVLNSPDESVVENAVRNLEYHTQFLDALNVDATAKIIVHIGGVYDDREAAMDRFVKRANDLSSSIRDRLVIENDESSYDIKQVLHLSKSTGLPVIFDWLHHQLNQPETERSIPEWLERCFSTWNKDDGVPKVHFSSASGSGGGHHADRINPDDFSNFQTETQHLEPFDVMLECKDKEVALLDLRKCLNGTLPET